MIDARVLRMYNSCYGEDTLDGKLMYKAQRKYFQNENMGTISKSTMKKVDGDDDAEYSIIGKGTTEQGFLKSDIL